MARPIARAGATWLAATGLVGLAVSAQALECPEPQVSSKPSVITETPAEIAEIAPVLTGADIAARVPAIVDGLRRRYPAAGAAEVANFLIAAYCPGVAKAAGLDEADKTARVRRFSRAVLGVLY